MKITSVKVPGWTPPPMQGFVNVEGKVLLEEPDIGLAMLRFGRSASLPEHPGETDNWVVCVEGNGFVCLGGEVAAIHAGQEVFWPKGVPHQLYTEDSEMVAIMVHPAGF